MKRIVLLMSLLISPSPVAWSQTNVPGYAVSSSKHYRASGVGNATGRAGSATMTARALLGKDGNTFIEVTTGTLDSSATPPGSFGKVQFKPFSSAGNALFAQNFTPLSGAAGYYSFVSPSLYRAEQVQLQGNISGIDNRTDVVTVIETVKLRPDLTVEGLAFPSSAIVSQPVNIRANIAELNGDAAATTSCLLAIDGSNVDQANNVYVDAGGSITCAFAYAFSTTGSHTIQVTAANVVPADWDTSNNSASGTITITNPLAQHAEASFRDTNGQFPSYTQSSQTSYLGNVIDVYSSTLQSSGDDQNSFVQFYSAGCAGSTNAAPWQLPVNVAYSEKMDGTSVYFFTDNVTYGYSFATPNHLSLCNSTAATYSQQYGSDSNNDHWIFLYSYQYYDNAANLIYSYQSVESTRDSGEVTYFSSGYQCYYWTQPSGNCNNPSDYYAWNSSSPTVYTPAIPVGSTWLPSLTTQDAAGNLFSGSISVPLTAVPFTNIQPKTCYNTGPDSNGYTYQTCSSFITNYIQTTGSAFN